MSYLVRLYTHSPPGDIDLMSYEQSHAIGRKTKAQSRKQKKELECDAEEATTHAPAVPSHARYDISDHRSARAPDPIQLPTKSAARFNDNVSTIAERRSSPTSIRLCA